MIVIYEVDMRLTFQIRKAKQEVRHREVRAGGDCTGIQTQVVRQQQAQL